MLMPQRKLNEKSLPCGGGGGGEGGDTQRIGAGALNTPAREWGERGNARSLRYWLVCGGFADAGWRRISKRGRGGARAKWESRGQSTLMA
jgi:hypothetical protein